jgi:site-specific recombinase XerD
MRRGIRLKGLISRRNADGSLRIYYRAANGVLTKLPSLPENDARFLKAYAEAVEGTPQRQFASKARAGSLGALVQSFLACRAHRDMKPGTRAYTRQHCDKILSTPERRGVPVSGIRARHIRLDLEPLTANAAKTRLKVWRWLMRHAIAVSWTEEDPTLGVRPPRIQTEGHHTWTREEVNQFRQAHPSGTEERMAFELMLWTGARRSDAVRLGRQMIGQDGWLTFTTLKTGQDVTVPLLCELPEWAEILEPERAHLEACISAISSRLTFIATQADTPRSAKAFGAWFRKATAAAGLDPRCTAHGLRKARAAELAEIGATEHQIGAWIGDRSLSEVVRYTRKAQRRRVLEGTEQKQKSGTSDDRRSNNPEKPNEIKIS